MTDRPRRFKRLWFPNLEGGTISFLIEVGVVALFLAAAVVVATVALWVF